MKMKKLSFLLFLTLKMGMAQAQEKLVALSFDDGPNTTTTVHMLDVLKKHQVKASFFVIGKNITQESAKVMIRAQKEGHDIENHSLTHSPMSQLSADSIRYEVKTTSSLVKKYVGKSDCQSFSVHPISMSTKPCMTTSVWGSFVAKDVMIGYLQSQLMNE